MGRFFLANSASWEGTGSPFGIYLGDASTYPITWNSQSVDISAYANANLKVRFHYYDAYDEDTWLINNVLRSVGAFGGQRMLGLVFSLSKSIKCSCNGKYNLYPNNDQPNRFQATSNVAVTYYANPVAGTVAVTDLSVSGNADLTRP